MVVIKAKRTAASFFGDAQSREEIAERSGISERQRKTAVRVANLPEEKFEAAIERPKPATVTQLAEMGRQIRAVPEDSFRRNVIWARHAAVY